MSDGSMMHIFFIAFKKLEGQALFL